MTPVIARVAKTQRAMTNQCLEKNLATPLRGFKCLWSLERTGNDCVPNVAFASTDVVCGLWRETSAAAGAERTALGCSGSDTEKDLIGDDWWEESAELKDDLLSGSFPFSKEEGSCEGMTGGTDAVADFDLVQNMAVGRE